MFEITIKNLENNEVTTYLPAGFCLMAIDIGEGEERNDTVDIRETSIEKMSNVIAMNSKLRASARIGVAKHESVKDCEEDEGADKLKALFKGLAGAMCGEED